MFVNATKNNGSNRNKLENLVCPVNDLANFVNIEKMIINTKYATLKDSSTMRITNKSLVNK